jgi:hypothetical protein
MEIKCGKGLAPDEGVSVDASVTEPLLSGASPLPQEIYCDFKIGVIQATC